VALRGARCRRSPPGLDQRDRLARRTGAPCGTGKALRIFDALDIDAEGTDPILVHQHLDQILDREASLVAHREQITDRQRTIVEHQRQGNRAALTNQRDTALGAFAHHLIGP